jgi:hypothetical protein
LVFCNFSRILFFYFMEKLEYKEIAAEALKLTSSDMKRQSGWHYTGTFRRSALR